MKFIDICAGIGGFRCGLEKAGHECIGYIEIDKFARKSYRAMYDTKDEWTAEDITQITAKEIPHADLWAFGFPCQDISVAGSQKGLDGKRSGIFHSIIELLKSKSSKDRPEWLLIENVKNLLSLHGGREFTEVLYQISQAGYDAQWYLINSKDHGVPQNRERVFIIAHFRDRGGFEILSETGTSGQADSKRQVEQQTRQGKEESKRPVGYKEAFNHMIGNRKYQNSHVYGTEGVSRACDTSGEIYYAIPKENDRSVNAVIQNKHSENLVLDSNSISRAVAARDYKGAQTVAVPTNTVKQIIPGDQAHRVYDSDGVAVTPKAEGGGVGAKTGLYTVPKQEISAVIQGKHAQNLVLDSDSITRAVRAGDYKGPQNVAIPCLTPDRVNKRQNGRRFKENQDPMLTTQDRHGVLIHEGNEYYIRRLTPKECFRLQGFTDEQFEKAEKVNSNSQLYKQAGNAVTVNVAYQIGKRLPL